MKREKKNEDRRREGGGGLTLLHCDVEINFSIDWDASSSESDTGMDSSTSRQSSSAEGATTGVKERKGGERTERLAGFGEKTSDFVDERPEPFQSGCGGQRPKQGEAWSGRREGRRAHALFEGRLKLDQAFFLRRGPDVGLRKYQQELNVSASWQILGEEEGGVVRGSTSGEPPSPTQERWASRPAGWRSTILC